MGKVIIVDLKRLNMDKSVVHSFEDVGENTVVMDREDFYWNEDLDHDVYVPASLLDTEINSKATIYHELAQYPFFNEIKSRILEDKRLSGVFRFRRGLEESTNLAVISSDLCVLESIFGEPGNIVVKRSKADALPLHYIIMIQYEGVMAHVEYTFSSKELIEIEWSGVGKIIEFHSDELKPLKPGALTSLPLSYRMESILTNSERFDGVMDTFYKYQKWIGGQGE